MNPGKQLASAFFVVISLFLASSCLPKICSPKTRQRSERRQDWLCTTDGPCRLPPRSKPREK